MLNIISQSLEKLKDYIESENFKGYDPYDTLNSWVPFHWIGKWGPVIAIQFQKRNPINIRPFLAIKKDYNPKAMGLFLQAYSILYAKTNKREYLDKADFFFEWLKENYSKGYSGYCWGYNFDWSSPGSYLKAFTPSVVVTAFVIYGIYEYYKASNDAEARKVIISSCDFILNDLPITTFADGISVAYTPQSKGCCYNASLLGAETLAKAYYITQDETYLTPARKAVAFVLSMQKEDGRWNYNFDPETGKERQQLDFHQGFILMSLHNFQKYSGINDVNIHQSVKKGCEYYYKKQFFDNGRSKWRIPKEWPVEIHNQAQGIMTFSTLKDYDNNYLHFAKNIAKWTIENMQDEKGYFYYHKHKFHTNRIPYMRWSQAWMLLALTTLKANSQEK